MPDQEIIIESKTRPGDRVRVVEKGDNVTILWVCGGGRTWTKEQMREALAQFESVNKVPEVLFSSSDGAGRGAAYFARVSEEGEFQANDVLFEKVTGVPWDKLRAAIAKASKAPPKRKPAAKKTPTAKKPAAKKTPTAKKPAAKKAK